MSRRPLPPFTHATAGEKARLAEAAWSSRDPAGVALAYTPDSQGRNRAEFINGRAGIEAFLTRTGLPIALPPGGRRLYVNDSTTEAIIGRLEPDSKHPF